MRTEDHLAAFEERKETVFKWGVEVKGIENAQRIIGDNASKAITELLSAYLHKENKVEEGFQLNHAWFKSETIYRRLPEFENKPQIVSKLMKLELLCEKLSYGSPKPIDKLKEALLLFEELETSLKEMLKC